MICSPSKGVVRAVTGDGGIECDVQFCLLEPSQATDTRKFHPQLGSDFQ